VPEASIIVFSSRVVLDAGIVPAAIEIAGGRITSIHEGSPRSSIRDHIDFGDLVIMPGLVDAHVHINEPGRTDWEGFETAGRAAAAGGITTVVDMPLNSSPVTTTVAALKAKAAAARGRCAIDYAFWGGVSGDNRSELEPLLGAGVLGFKCFMVPSGIDDFPAADDEEIGAAMRTIASAGGVLLAHAEDATVIEAARSRCGLDRHPRAYQSWLRSRPPEAEVAAIRRLATLCRETRCRTHIVHIASGEAADAIAAFKREGLPMSGETCPHYLTFAAEDITDGATLFKCAPPIRERAHQDRLWRALESGILDMVATDHSPCPPDLKRMSDGDFVHAWGGIASLQLSLPAVWTAARRRATGIERLAQWMSAAPSRLAGLQQRKGAIRVGYDADLVIWNPEASFTVQAESLLHRHKVCPYVGMTLHGVVERTYLRGELAFDRSDPSPLAKPPRGQWLRRAQH